MHMHMFKLKYNYKRFKNLLLFNSIKHFSSIRNLTSNVEDKLDKKLYLRQNHPISIIKSKITTFFDEYKKSEWSKLENLTSNKFAVFEDLPQIVSTKECFDNLLVDKNHETRSPKNTYFVDDSQILRTHMTAFDVPLIKSGNNAFISVGDVFRRDTIDATHYPVFHQVDGVRLFNINELKKNPYSNNHEPTEIIKQDLQYCLENLIK